MIADYLCALERALSFDPALARRVRAEAEDHLREAAASDPIPGREEAERRAVASFGEPLLVAAEFAALSIVREKRRAGYLLVLGVGLVFAAMKLRVAWYQAAAWTLAAELQRAAALTLQVDFWAFWLAAAGAALGWTAALSGTVPAVPARSRQHPRGGTLRIAIAATAALVIAILADAVLTALRLVGARPSFAFLPPAASLALEIACGVGLVWCVARAVRRTRDAAALIDAVAPR